MFRKMKNKRGSVLFMVLSVMTVLLIIAQGLYLSVVISRQTHFNEYNETQAHFTGVTINEIVSNQIRYSRSASLNASLEMLPVGGTLEFDSLEGGLSDEELARIGEIKSIQITRKPTQTNDAKSYDVFDIITVTERNGIEERVKTTMLYTDTPGTPVSFDRFFMATGYSTDDVYIDKAYLFDPAYFDNQYTQISGGNVFNNISCAGSLVIESSVFSAGKKALDLVVRNDLTLKNLDGNGETKGSIYVGGSLYLPDSNGKLNLGNNSKSVYVIGNLVANKVEFGEGITLFVNGDVNITNLVGNQIKIYTNGNVNITNGNATIYHKPGKTIVSNGTKNVVDVDDVLATATGNLMHCVNNIPQEFIFSGNPLPISVSNVQTLIDQKTVQYTYPKWQPSDGVENFVDQKLEFNATTKNIIKINNQNTNVIDITVGANDTWSKADDGNLPTLIIKTPTLTDAQKTALENKEETLEGLGLDPVVFKLKANSSSTGSADPTKFDTFCWAGRGSDNKPNRSLPVNVIVDGDVPVFFEIEDGVKYVNTEYNFVGHKSFYSVFMQNYNYDENRTKFGQIKPTVFGDNYNNPDQHPFRDYNKYISNAFIVSVDENADIDISGTGSFTGGYIYAPYMTYDTGYINSTGIAMAGGMIVADYILGVGDHRGYYYYPLPNYIGDLSALMGDDVISLPIPGGREWRKRW